MKPGAAGKGGKGPAPAPPKGNVLDAVNKLQAAREERRAAMEEKKKEKAEKEEENQRLGRKGDVDFALMIAKNRYKTDYLTPHTASSKLKICICVRKRPLFKKEETAGENDSVSVANPEVKVHECKLRVDGITKYVDNHTFVFDNAFSEKENSDDLYKYSIQPLIDFILNEGIVTCFAYGQTGSGKTFTMKGVQDSCIDDLFEAAGNKFAHLGIKFYVSFFEIYGGRCFDLLNSKAALQILEDKNNEVQIPGLVDREIGDPTEMRKVIEYANSVRTTHATVSNDTSSRSHAICQIILRSQSQGKPIGKLLLVDLAGSERAQDTQSNNRQRRLEGAEINKSLLALKECIRAMDQNQRNAAGNHVPFRASKLTMVLRDSFVTKRGNSRIVMIACLSPGSSSADHTLNTLRYADRLKDRGTTEKEVGDYVGEPGNFEEKKHEVEKPVAQPPVRQAPPPVNPKPAASKPEPAAGGEKLPKVSSKNDLRQPPQPHPKEENPNKPVSKPPNLPYAPRTGAGADKGDKKQAQEAKGGDKDKDDDLKDTSVDEEDRIQKASEDLKFMKKTMKLDAQDKETEKFFDFQEKVTKIIEHQDELFVTHMSAIKKDASLLTEESDLIANVQQMGEEDVDIDVYVQKLEDIVKKKLHMYNVLNKRLQKFKELLKEEEEMSTKVKSTFYY